MSTVEIEKPVKIERGRIYIARNGSHVRVYATDGNFDQPVHGALCYDGMWYPHCWTEDGFFFVNKEESMFDIVRGI